MHSGITITTIANKYIEIVAAKGYLIKKNGYSAVKLFSYSCRNHIFMCKGNN